MESGAITSYVDVAQLVLYAFWIFFAGLIYYLVRENHRDGYPLETDRGVIGGWPQVTDSKQYELLDGTVAEPYGKPMPPPANAEALHRTAGGPIVPLGNPLTAGIGPGSWTERRDVVDLDHHGRPKILPLRLADGCGVSDKDPDPRGMTVTAADDEPAGVVRELWLDTAEMMFRYLEVEIPGGRHVLVPVPFARIRRSGVQVNALLAAQFADIPSPKSMEQVSRLEEEKIVAYFGAGTLYAEPGRQESLL